MGWLDFLFGSSRVKQLEKELGEAKAQRDKLAKELANLKPSLQDALDQVKAEQEARQKAESQLSELASKLEEARASLKQKDELIAELTARLQEQAGALAQENAQLKESVQSLEQQILSLSSERAALYSQLNSPYSQDVPGLLKNMLLSPSCQSLSIPLKTRLRFDLAKVAFLALARQDIKWQEQDAAWVVARLREAFPNARIHDPKDGKYRILADRQSLTTILESSFAPLRPYVAELHDCDDFARELSIHADIWWLINSLFYSEDLVSLMHAYNVPLLSGEVMVVEPQGNQVMTVVEAEAAGYKTSDIYP